MAIPEHAAQPSSTVQPVARAARWRWSPRAAVIALLAGSSIALTGVLPADAGWPVATQDSYVSQRYHRGHAAMDIAARKWSRVVPIQSGRVVFAGWRSNCGGWQVWVSHGSGRYSAYYHLAKETAFRGEWVTGGRETIGYVGTSGCVTGPHLHVEVWSGYPWRAGSRRVNPWTYVDHGSYLPSRYR